MQAGTLEQIESEQETVPKPPIVHAFCRICEDESGVCVAFCGLRLVVGSSATRNPLPPDQCTMCVEVKDTLPPNHCPKGHYIRGLI